ncbi:reverse transcriptase domain-containing protein [Tanacetum coccineum]
MSTREHEKRQKSRRSRSPRPSPSVFSRIRREWSGSPRQKLREKEGGVFKRLGNREKSVSERSDSHNQRFYSRYTEAFSESEDSGGGHWKSRSKKKKPSREEDDLSQPWVCEEIDPFTPRIRYFDFPKTRMPSHIKTYDGSEDPEDHLKIFQAAAKTERWAMPTWCHMFNSTLTGNARNKYIKDPIELHNIKQRDGESMKDFVRRYKLESRDVKGAPECMRIFGFVHGITNPELIKRLHDKIPKTVDEMMRATTSFPGGKWQLRITNRRSVKNLQANVDSRLVANHVNGTYVAKEADMIRYLEKVRTLTSSFKAFSIRQIPRSENKKADALSKIASTSFAHLSKQVLVEELKEKSISEVEILAVVEEEGDTWMTPIFEYLKDETLPADVKKARAVRRKSQRFAVINGTLYRKSFLGPWLRCVGPLQANYVLREIHEGSCSMHAGTRSVVAKALRIGYYWPTMHKDARALIRACQDCQVHKPVPRNPQQKLTPITSPWPFYKWGIDIAGPFSEGPGKVKFLIVAMDYFTKWIEAKPVATITGNQIKKFVWDNIVCRFGLPGEIISDNGKQFRDNPFKDWCEKLCIRQHFASVKHPQTNGLVERANRSLGEGIKARLGARNKKWMEELSHVLWAHRTMIKSSNGDTPFSLTYGTEAVIPQGERCLKSPVPKMLKRRAKVKRKTRKPEQVLGQISREIITLITELPMLTAPMEKEELIVYLAAAKETVNSRLVANQVKGTYIAKEVDMIRYLEKVRTLTSSFKAFSIRQIPRSENKKADALRKIASTGFAHLSKQVLVEELKEKSINEVEILAVVEEKGDTWMTLIFEYLKDETLPADVKKAKQEWKSTITPKSKIQASNQETLSTATMMQAIRKTGKLGPKWEGSYEVTEALGKGAYKLRDRDGKQLPRTWNVSNLKKCLYSQNVSNSLMRITRWGNAFQYVLLIYCNVF